MRKLCRFSQLSLVGMYSWKTQLIQMEFRISILRLQQADFCFVLKRRYYLPRNNPYRISGITFRMRFIMVPSEVMETLSMLRLEKTTLHSSDMVHPESWLMRTGMAAPTQQSANPSAATQAERICAWCCCTLSRYPSCQYCFLLFVSVLHNFLEITRLVS